MSGPPTIPFMPTYAKRCDTSARQPVRFSACPTR